MKTATPIGKGTGSKFRKDRRPWGGFLVLAFLCACVPAGQNRPMRQAGLQQQRTAGPVPQTPGRPEPTQDSAEALVAIGRQHMDKDEKVQAEELFKKALAKRPDYAAGWTNLGWVHHRMAQYEDMRFDFDNAVRYGAGQDPWATFGLALANFHLGRNDTAKPLFLEAKSKIDKDVTRREITHYLYAIAVRQDDADAARRFFDEAPMIGLRLQSVDNRCQIVQFGPDSLASLAGVLVGDILLSINGSPIQAPQDAQKAAAATRFGDTVRLQVERDKKPRTIELVLDYRHYRPGRKTEPEVVTRQAVVRNDATSQKETPAPLEAIPDSRKFKLAVMEFQTFDQKPENSRLGSMIAEMFTTEIVESRAFRIVEREQLEKVLKELKVAQSGIVDTTQAQKVGKMVGAAVIVTGSVMKVGERLRIDSRIIEVETGVIVSADSRLCAMDLDELTRAVAQMTGDLAKKFYRDK